MLDLDALETVADQASPGPWQWEVNECTKRITLQGGTPRFDCTVMDFVRYGMTGAMPRFVTEPRPYLNLMAKATEFTKVVEGREHHASWFKTLDNQDANFIATFNPAVVKALIRMAKVNITNPIT